jgi:uncharacterized protein (DUF1330 family)
VCGRFLVRGGATELIKGGPQPKTIVLIEFPDAGFEAVVLFIGILEDLAEPAG